MTNTAKILNFGRGNFAEQELRVADIDDGYTRFANELLEAIASADLTARQLKVMLAYVRKTYGFNKKTDRILVMKKFSLTLTMMITLTGNLHPNG